MENIKNSILLNIPEQIKDKAFGYQNPHFSGGYCKQTYLEEDLKLYQSNHIAFEKTLDEWINKIKNKGN